MQTSTIFDQFFSLLKYHGSVCDYSCLGFGLHSWKKSTESPNISHWDIDTGLNHEGGESFTESPTPLLVTPWVFLDMLPCNYWAALSLLILRDLMGSLSCNWRLNSWISDFHSKMQLFLIYKTVRMVKGSQAFMTCKIWNSIVLLVLL